jgi:hypothetical protein
VRFLVAVLCVNALVAAVAWVVHGQQWLWKPLSYFVVLAVATCFMRPHEVAQSLASWL